MRPMMILAAIVMMSAACTADTDPSGDGTAAEAPGCDPELVEALGRWADAGFSGSIAITAEGEFACRAGFGLADAAAAVPNTADTVFAIGSVSKSFTAAAVLDLVDTGALALDDTAGDLLPGLDGPAAEATVEQLLLHTSGLSGSHGSDHEPLGRDEAVEAMGSLDSAFEPGTDFLYSNSGYTLLALVIDEISGSSHREYMAEEILDVEEYGPVGGFWDGEPAAPGARAVGYEEGEPSGADGGFDGPHWALAGNGDLAMSAPDLAAWTAALFEGAVVSPEAVELLNATGFAHGDGTTEAPGWAVFDEELFGTPVAMAAGGGGDTGHHAVTAWLPETRRSIALTSNTSEITAEALLESIGPALASGEPVPVPEGHAVEVDPAELQRHAGAYVLETGGTLTVAAAGDGLVVSADGADAVDAMFEPGGGFTAEDVADHEAAVLELLNGATEAGRDEREILESDMGTIEDVEVAGTVADDGELRTFVRIATESGTALAWYALDEHGGVAAAWLEAEPPEFALVPVGDGAYRQRNLDGAGLGVRVTFEEDLMTITGPGGTAEARRE